MKFFFDCEFDARGLSLALISVGMVAEDGRELYLVNADYDWTGARDWLQDNVRPSLAQVPASCVVPQAELRRRVLEFVAAVEVPEGRTHEFFAYNAAFDWVVLTGALFETLAERPASWPSGVRDIKEYARLLGNPTMPAQESGLHDALADARWARGGFDWLRQFQRDQVAEKARKARVRVLDEAAAAVRALREA